MGLAEIFQPGKGVVDRIYGRVLPDRAGGDGAGARDLLFVIRRWRDTMQRAYLLGAAMSDPIIFDGRDEAQLIEASAVYAQRQTGRELGGDIVVITNGYPRSFDGQLAYDYLQGKVEFREVENATRD